MALIDQYNLSQSATFVNRVRQACINAGYRFADTTVANEQRFVVTARHILDDPASYAARVAEAIAQVAPISTKAATELVTPNTITDAEIQTAVDAALLKFVR